MGKLRFTKQRSGHCCAPTAVANILKWGGIPFSYRENRKELKMLLHCTKDGTSDDWTYLGFLCLNDVLGQPFRIKYVSQPTQKRIREHLAGGGCVLMGTEYESAQNKGQQAAHAYTLVKTTSKAFKAVNGIGTWGTKKKLLRNIPRKKMNKLLRHRNSRAWLVEKRVHWIP